MPTPHYDFPRTEMLAFVPEQASRVLDVGCGAGGFGRSLLAARPAVELWGVEPDPVGAEAARQSGYRHVADGTFEDAAADLPSGHFDAVLFFDVLEHTAAPAAALQAAHRLLAPQGELVASIPNVRHFSVWWPLVVRGRWDYTDYGILDRTHLRFFTRTSMRELFAATGWEVVSTTGINRTATAKTNAARALTRRRVDEFLYMQYVLVARPA
jgi:2-polyprenyl-3-methyl-5-hydroxy-6-metoxy-1,4-benzoquinol methylase